ncbi:hypothetical protein [Azospirillum sp.]|uniref:hypothetical protein n=1 Tax=Azospirillum sp. TaxID=34012 RepID=UPI002D71F372|nr:hypothetical protein [Azospirillum sp.]HYD68129.1 hypothetical protein [Azospirillum sp.]
MTTDDVTAHDMSPDGYGMDTAMEAVTTAQPLLFDSLPETEGRSARRRPRRARTAGVGAGTVAATVARDVVQEPVPAPPPAIFAAPPPPPRPPEPAVFDPAALSNAEISALVRALPDLRLSHLLVEAARELKRRVEPPAWDDEEDAGPREPNPSLLRAARLVVGEFAGDGD